MPTADEAAQFVKELIELEYDAEVSRNTETDDAFTPKLTKLNRMFSDQVRVVSGISRPAGMSREELNGLRIHADNTRRRRFVAMFEFKHPKYGAVFACHVTGNTADSNDAPERVWYVAKLSEGWRVLSYDRACFECDGTGKINEKSCRDCHGSGWVHGDGVNFGNLGSPVSSKSF